VGQIGKAIDPPPCVRVVTDAGDLLIELYIDRAPRSAVAFLSQVEAGAYDGGTFARAVRFDNDQGMPQIQVIQAGVAPPPDLSITVEHEPY
jgi:cyclophilin family peptidyl-prolyl cis-trans isomerase